MLENFQGMKFSWLYLITICEKIHIMLCVCVPQLTHPYGEVMLYAAYIHL